MIRHAYIERRMVPLNIYLQDANPAQVAQAVVEYGNAIKDLVSANIFPGDMLWKNFGVTRHGKVVFYDYDEIEYLTDCNFRRVPAAAQRGGGDVGRDLVRREAARRVPRDLRARSCSATPTCAEVFMAEHADLLDAAYWQQHKERILAGYVHDVFPYDPSRRFSAQRAARTNSEAPATQPASH